MLRFRHKWVSQCAFWFVLFLESAFAQNRNYVLKPGSFVSPGNAGAERVDLSRLFLDEVSLQESGSCHIHAATAVIEAFCKKVTGVKIDVSESYFFYRHLRNQLVSAGMSDLASDDLLSSIEGGDVRRTIARFKSGSVCAENEFKMSEKGLMELTRMVSEFSASTTRKLKDKYKQANERAMKACKTTDELVKSLEKIRVSYENAFRAEVCEAVDDQVRCQVSPMALSSNLKEIGVVGRTKNGVLQKCIRSLDKGQLISRPTNDQILKILKGGDPVICTGNFIFTPGLGFDGNQLFGSGGHAFIIYGYQKDKKTNKVEFLTRDSNFSKLHPFTVTGCDRIVVLRQKTP